MAQVTGAFDTYEAKGNREQLINAIYNVDPTETPLVSGATRPAGTATFYEWQTDVLETAAQNAQLEGDEITRSPSDPTTRPGNRMQISYKDATVTGTQEVVAKGGRGSELSYQMAKRSKELRRDIETDYSANNAQVAGDASTAREAAGIESFLATNTNRGLTGTDPTGDGTDEAGDGTPRAFDEADLQDVIAKCWDSGGNPDTIMVGSFNKQALSAFTGRASARQQVDASTVHANVDLYASNFGDLKVVPNRFSRPESALVLQMDMWKLPVLQGRDMLTFPLGTIGDAKTEVILTEWSLEASNEKSSGIVADLTTA